MLVLQEQLKYCPHCDRQTVHQRNNKRMSWGMHFVLTVFTLGLWLFVWSITVIWHLFTKPIAGRWTCSVCGQKEGHLATLDRITAQANRAPSGFQPALATPRAAPAPTPSRQIAPATPRPPVPALAPITTFRQRPASATGTCDCGRLRVDRLRDCPHCGHPYP